MEKQAEYLNDQKACASVLSISYFKEMQVKIT